MSQEFQIEHYLRQGNSLTPIDALNMFGCFRLSGRILELRQKGLDIVTDMIESNGKRFASYRLKVEEVKTVEVKVGKQDQMEYAL